MSWKSDSLIGGTNRTGMVIDETAFAKKGKCFACVAKQWNRRPLKSKAQCEQVRVDELFSMLSNDDLLRIAGRNPTSSVLLVPAYQYRSGYGTVKRREGSKAKKVRLWTLNKKRDVHSPNEKRILYDKYTGHNSLPGNLPKWKHSVWQSSGLSRMLKVWPAWLNIR